jgi:hypothetical protein
VLPPTSFGLSIAAKAATLKGNAAVEVWRLVDFGKAHESRDFQPF